MNFISFVFKQSFPSRFGNNFDESRKEINYFWIMGGGSQAELLGRHLNALGAGAVCVQCAAGVVFGVHCSVIDSQDSAR